MAISIPQPRRRPRRGVLVLAGLAVVLAWGVLTLVTLLEARRQTQAGIDKLERARAEVTPTGLVEGRGIDLLRDAEADFTRARDRVRSPLVAPLRILPVLGRQVRAVDAMAGAAARVVDIGVDAIEDAGARLEGDQPAGPQRVDLARDLGAIAGRSARLLERVDLGPGEALVGPVDRARERFDEELANLLDTAGRMRDAAGGFGDFLEGPTSYLVLAANNAEMRVGSGTFLSVGVLTVADGDFTLGDMQPTREFALPDDAVALDGRFADLGTQWGWLAPNREWRNLGSSPRFDVQGALAARMWRAATGQEVDGVLALDPVALRALLAAAGPVVVEGREISAGNVVQEVLLEQYAGLESYDAVEDFEQQERRDRLSAIARAAIDRLDAGGWDAVDLVEELRRAAEGRHVLAWSARPAQQRGWASAGIAGRLGADDLLLGLHNRAGNKLDQFLALRARLTTRELDGGGTEVRVLLELRNLAPEGLPRYVEGPYPQAEGGAAGLYQGLVVAELPALARDFAIESAGGEQRRLVASGADGAAWVAAAYVEVPRGASTAVVVRFRLPPGADEVRVAPSARIPPVAWTYGTESWIDDRARRVSW